MRRVVVTGLGALTPIGNTIGAFNEGLQQGRSGAAPITRFDASQFKTQFACEVKGFDVGKMMDVKAARRLDPFAQYAMAVADEAILDSGLDLEKINRDRAGVIWASGIGGFTTFEDEIEEAGRATGVPRYSPFLIVRLISDIAPGHISIKYGFRGINYCTVSACASSNHAIANSVDYIKLGKADVMISGGSEAAVTRAGVGGFGSMKALSVRNNSPQTASRPFDKDRDGFVLGEGAGALVLEAYEHAQARGARIYAEVLGSGMTADAYHITAPHPDGLGAKHVMNLAVRDSGLQLTDIEYINVHGTSTPLGDVSEVRAIEAVFKDHAYAVNISSTKSMTGHLLGAAGAIEAIACVLAITHDYVPPTINHFTDDPEINERLNFTFNEAQQRKVKYALSNTFGFGGHNASLVFAKI